MSDRNSRRTAPRAKGGSRALRALSFVIVLGIGYVLGGWVIGPTWGSRTVQQAAPPPPPPAAENSAPSPAPSQAVTHHASVAADEPVAVVTERHHRTSDVPGAAPIRHKRRHKPADSTALAAAGDGAPAADTSNVGGVDTEPAGVDPASASPANAGDQATSAADSTDHSADEPPAGADAAGPGDTTPRAPRTRHRRHKSAPDGSDAPPPPPATSEPVTPGAGDTGPGDTTDNTTHGTSLHQAPGHWTAAARNGGISIWL